MMNQIDTATLNSEAADQLVRAAVASGSRGGPSILGTPCAFAGCMSFSAPRPTPQMAPPLCPLHAQPVFPYENKDDISFCPGCYDAFSQIAVMGLGDGRHHCHVCGQVYCGSCADYQVLSSVSLPVRAPLKHRNPLHGLHVFKATGADSDNRRCCMRCASLLHPSLTKRVSAMPFQLNMAHVPLDVCFVFDATASMVSHIELVEREIEAIASDIHRHHYVDPRFFASAYRDHQYGNRLVNMIEPQNHVHKFRRLVEHVRAFGAPNNDIPESVASGLALAQMGCGGVWRPLSVKLLILIADAPPHGKPMYSSQVAVDAFPDGDPTGLDPQSQIQSLADDGVTVYTIGVEPSAQRDGADMVLRSFAAHGGGQHVVLEEWHHANLHHFIAAAACDLVVKAVAAQELQEVALRQGLATFQDLSPQLRASVAARVATRLKTRTMPRFVFSEPAGRRSTQSTRNLPVVTGFHRAAMNDTDLQGYVDGVVDRPPVNVPYAGAGYSAPPVGVSVTGASVNAAQMSHWVTQGTAQTLQQQQQQQQPTSTPAQQQQQQSRFAVPAAFGKPSAPPAASAPQPQAATDQQKLGSLGRTMLQQTLL